MNSDPTQDVIEAWVRLARAAQSVLSDIEGELKLAKLPTLAWYDVLHEISSSKPRGLRPYELVERMLLAQYNASRLIARMEKQGLVFCETSPEDGRGQIIRITKAGRNMRRRIWSIYGPALQRRIGAKLSQPQLRQLRELLGRLG